MSHTRYRGSPMTLANMGENGVRCPCDSMVSKAAAQYRHLRLVRKPTGEEPLSTGYRREPRAS